MKRQPLNILLGPARLAPRTIPPLIELVLLFQVPAFFPCYFGIRRLRNGRAPGLRFQGGAKPYRPAASL